VGEGELVGLKAVEECCWCAELGERVERNTSLLFVETEDNCSCVMHTVSELLQHTLPTRQRALALASTMEQICKAPGSSPDSKVSTVQNDAVKMNVVELA
jgi:hypothetical protein